MGNIFWNRSLSTKEQLEEIQNDIDRIETFKLRSSVQEKNSIALLYFISVLSYIACLIYIYVNIFNDTSVQFKVFSILIIVLIPICVFFIRKLLKLWYRWTIDTNNTRLVEVLKLKKKILSKVQETETFNEARLILEKYDPQALRNMSMSLQNLSSINSGWTQGSVIGTMTSSPPSRSRSYTRNAPMPSTPGSIQRSSNTSLAVVVPNNASSQNSVQHARTIRPILPSERSVVEKVVDYMFSDGPESRYALICFQCRKHNGMALKDEFEYMSYCCAYCGAFNPARKTRPQAAIQAPPMPIDASKEPTIEEPDEKEYPRIEEIGTVLNKTLNTSSRSSTTNITLRKRGKSQEKRRNSIIVSDPVVEETDSQGDKKNEYFLDQRGD